MEQERWEMNQRERDRLKVLHEVKKKQISQGGAARQLGVTERQVRRMLVLMRQRRDRVVVHGLRGRSSNRRIAEEVEKEVLRLVAAEYRDFGPTLAAEYLAEEKGLQVSRETLRKWMMRAGLWWRRKQGVGEVHVWRPRRSCWGELVQWDSSDHDWLEGRGPRIYLVALIDDATSRLLARFVPHDSTAENMKVVWMYLERYGRPVAFYRDKASLFETNRPQQRDEELQGQLPRTQIGRAMEELQTGWIAAHSPQAKGRIERCFQTLQDRLVKGLRKAGVCTLEQANEYLEKVFLPFWEKRFTVAPANLTNAHRPLGKEHQLAGILCHVETRLVMKDYTIRFQGQSYRMARQDIGAGLRGSRVRVEKRLDGSIAVRFRERYVPVELCPPQRKPAAVASAARPARQPGRRPRSGWMKNFDLHNSPPIWKAMADSHRLGRPSL